MCRTWAKDLLAGGGSRAHLWTKVPTHWQQEVASEVLHEEGSLAAKRQQQRGEEATKWKTAGPVEVLQMHRSNWKGVWNATDEQDQEADDRLWAMLDKMVEVQKEALERWWIDTSHLSEKDHGIMKLVADCYKPIQGEQVAAASKGFKERTTKLGGLHPRFASWIAHGHADHAHRTTAQYLNEVENTGVFGKQDQFLTVLLAPKPTPGRRPITQFSSMYRVWGKARKKQVARWEEAALEDSIFNTAKRRSTTDAVWRAEMRAEGAKTRRNELIQLMWDIRKAFETVIYERLMHEAENNKAPMHIIRVVVMAYRWCRRLTLDGVVACPLWPQNGVAAGCWAALMNLKLYMANVLRAQARDYEYTVLTTHVDDILQF